MIPDGYSLTHQISSTESAQVWHALDPSGQPVVLKLASNDERVERRFKREVGALHAAAGPHTMPVLAFDDSLSWYSMPVAGRTLWECAVPASLDDGVLVIEAVAAALGPIHALGQVHRDLKPQNILWLDDGTFARWVVADFGIVRNSAGLTTEQLTRVNGLTGTQGWAAPEQYRDAHIATVTADVYSAGAIFAWMLTGDRPSLGHVSLPTHPRLRAVLKRATNVDPNGRYATVDELLASVKASTAASSPTLEYLLETQAWMSVGAYLSANLARLDRIITVLPKLSARHVRDWCAVDQPGLSSSVIEIAEEMATDYSDLPYGDVDRFIIWGIAVLEQLLHDRKYGVAEEVASALFGATARIHQFKPATAIIEWLNKLDHQGQQAMETALYSSGSFEFFRSHANSRWRQRGANDLIVRLRGEG